MTKTARVPINVDVTPMLRNGNSIFCEIDPTPGTPRRFVKGGFIKLPRGGQYEIIFHLMAGDVGPLQFDTEDPFCSDSSTCPALGAQNGQYSNPRVTSSNPLGVDDTLSVDAAPAPPKNAVHYRLNFNGGAYCDPIIINDV